LSNIERALQIAYEAHKGQHRRGSGDPYVTHPIAVADIAVEEILPRFPQYDVSVDDVKMVALLHDVVEDSEWTIEDLEKEGFSYQVTSSVDALTKKDDDYLDYILNLRRYKIPSIVKTADITHNLKTTEKRDKKHKYELAIQLIKDYN
jgi:(p)ppGpp synthase/HD superfamily hydrolase